MRSLKWKTAAALIFALAGRAAASPTLTIRPEKFRPSEGAPVDAEFGELSVPANHSRPDGPRITLAFVRFPATGRHPGAPIVYLAGGPGVSGIEAARGPRFPMFQALRELGDVVALDQRGTGKSRPKLSCSESYRIPFDRPLDRASGAAALAAGIRPCRERLEGEGVNLNDYNTPESAADLDDLRVALGAAKIRLLAISYGTHLALAMLRDHAASIDRVALAGIEPLDHTEKLPSDLQALLVEVARRVREDAAVRAALPDLEDAVRRIDERLEREPVRVALTDPRNARSAEVVLGKLDFQFALSEMIADEGGIAAVPDFVARVARGDWTALALAAAPWRIGHVPSLMSIAMDCASGADDAWRARIREEAPRTLLGDAINLPFPEVCPAVGVRDLGPAYRLPVKSDVPALLIAGTLDGRTPVSNAREVMKNLPNARLLVIDGAAHSDPLFLSNPAIVESIRGFFAGEEQPRERTIPAEPLRFVAPRHVADVAPERLSRYVGEYKIEGGGVRRVVRAGPLLFTIRDSGSPLAIRPASETEFFYEGQSAHLRFEIGDGGKVAGMVMFQDDRAAAEKAKKVK